MGSEILGMFVMTLVVVLLICPWILTIWNLFYLFKKEKKKENALDLLIFLLGISLTILLYCIFDYKSYDEALLKGSLSGSGLYHEPIASKSMPTILLFSVIGIFSYAILRIKKLDLPPLAIVLCMSGMIIGTLLSAVWMIQISKNLDYMIHLYYILFPFNYILCCMRLYREVMQEYQQRQPKTKKYQNAFLNKCNQILEDSSTWPQIAIVLTIPILMIIMIILTLFGQRPDEFIKAFTETSDWRLSTKISPPPLEFDAHYLCTVALQGHPKCVKPLRYGIRQNHRIVVNRQLCVANAFEDYIQEKLPKTHHIIRSFYDTYGYPIAKHIKTPMMADITYYIMKPLEYFFVLFLYLFDKKPENRIAIQYIPNKRELLSSTIK